MRVTERYRPSLGLLTDLYQLTMAYGYWKSGLASYQACFHLFFRKHPFGGGYTVTAGLPDALDHVAHLAFDRADLTYLAGLTARDGSSLFEPDFLEHLASLRLEVDIDAVPEGTVMFPNEPVMRVTGPILHCQLLETPLLNLINFPSLIATKAARVCDAAGWQPVLEFGLRRAQGPDGGVTAARAAYVGGCDSTSNVLAGRLFGIPVKGTHAHSWVMAWGEDRAAFRAWSQAMPENCIFLVDTYDSIEGVKTAIEVARELRARGHEMVGIRLDSGDLAALSVEARRLLDDGGFPDAKILGSGDLDEEKIGELRRRGSTIQLWGVGTHMTTGYPDPALNGVYKLAAVRPPEGEWKPRIKVSDSPGKTTIPGLLAVRRYLRDGRMEADAIHDVRSPLEGSPALVSPEQNGTRRTVDPGLAHEDLLIPVVRGGRVTYVDPGLTAAQARARRQVEALPDGARRLHDPDRYFVGLEEGLHQRRAQLMRAHSERRG
ncbi:MAG: nicotinate phosphoribosyltransferase [Myxococcota bacterium]